MAKYTHGKQVNDHRKPVAFLKGDQLFAKEPDWSSESIIKELDSYDFNADLETADVVFYEGESVTITF